MACSGDSWTLRIRESADSVVVVSPGVVRFTGFMFLRDTSLDDCYSLVVRWTMLRLIAAKDQSVTAGKGQAVQNPRSRVTVTPTVVVPWDFSTASGANDPDGYLSMVRWAMGQVIDAKRNKRVMCDGGDD